MKNPSAISLFSGTGGLDLGVASAGFDIRFQIDKVADCCQTLELNRAKYWVNSKIVCGDVQEWSAPRILETCGLRRGEIALVCGGPPCQPFSKSAFWSPKRWADGNSRRPKSNSSRSAESFVGFHDPRAKLLEEFARVILEIRPSAYIMENVFGLAYKTSRPMLQAVKHSLEESGYSFNAKVLNAADYGVPQKRERLFITGFRDKRVAYFPDQTHCNKKTSPERICTHRPYVTARDAIGDLDDGKVGSEEKVGGRWGYLLPKIPPGGNYLFFTSRMGYKKPLFRWRSRFWSFLLKLDPDRPSWTIQAQPGPYIGPFHWKNRRLRQSEIRRLQTFPDDYIVYGNRISVQRQLGDAVPPLLAKKVAEAIKVQLEQAESNPLALS